ncbi:MAG: LLM class flavin-dependent oxidoreductase [Deltaproteobacteria bacterium]|nr:LLM class flavin-dependent oxidoreductase [Deltaproteobacteria bacterium]
MPPIKFGVGLYGTDSAQEAVKLGQLADELGYDRFWIGDSNMIWRELYVLAGAIAATTKRIAIGPGVTHLAGRHITVTASAMVTLHELSGGRVFLGFGVGASGPANIGMKPIGVDEIEANIETLQKLFGGESVEINGKQAKCLFPCGSLPIYIGTRAPRVMKMACRVADGFIHSGESPVLQELVNQIRGYTREAGRESHSVEFVYRLPCAIDNDPATAREAVKSVVARTAMTQLGRLYDRDKLDNEDDRRAIERMRREYDTYHHMDAVHSYLVRDEWVERFALAGATDRIKNKVQEFADAGIDELTIIPCGKSRRAVIENFAKAAIARS